MKKNLRIVSAAAAALLAVAPIATVAVSNNSAVVQAADATQSTTDYSHINLGGQTINNNTVANVNPSFTLTGAQKNAQGQVTTDGKLTGSITANALGVTATANLVNGDNGSADIKVTADGDPSTVIYDGTTNPVVKNFDKVVAGDKYQIVVNKVGFNFGANNAGKKVTLALPNNDNIKFTGSVAGWTISSDGKTITGSLNNNGTVNNLQITETVTAFDATNTNDVVFYNIATGEKATEGNAMVLANYNGQLNLNAILPAIKSNYAALQRVTSDSTTEQNGTYNQNGFAGVEIKLTDQQLREQLKNDGVKVDANGNFTAPHSFKVTATATSEINGKSAQLPVTFTVANVAAPKTEEKGVDKTIMHNAYYYDKDGQRVGKGKITRYETVSVVEKTVSINGQSYYKLANTTIDGKDVYVNADNIDGTKRTLKHNAYVYASSKKRANKQVLKKGTEVTTYGAPYTFKNGKKYYKINNDKVKTYVKASNF